MGKYCAINLTIFIYTFVKYRDHERVNLGSYLCNILDKSAYMYKMVKYFRDQFGPYFANVAQIWMHILDLILLMWTHIRINLGFIFWLFCSDLRI